MSEPDVRKVNGRKPLRRPDIVSLSTPEKRKRDDSSPERRSSRDKVSVAITEDALHESSSSSSSGRHYKSSRKHERTGGQTSSPSHSSKRSRCADENDEERRRRKKKKEKKQKREAESGEKLRKRKKQKRSPHSASPEEPDKTIDERMMRPPTIGYTCGSSNKDDEDSNKRRVVLDEKKERKKRERYVSPDDSRSRKSRRDDSRREETPKRRSRSPRRELSSRGVRGSSKSKRPREYQPSLPSNEKRSRPSELSSRHRSRGARSRSRSASKTSVDKKHPGSGLPSLLPKRSRISAGAINDSHPIFTLVQQLDLEATSDTEFEALLPEGLLNGGMAKLSMGRGVGTKGMVVTTASVLELLSGGREQQPDDNGLTLKKPQEDAEVDEKECLDRMLGALSDELRAKAMSVETWDSTAGVSSTSTDLDLETSGDLDPEELGTLAASGAMTSALRLATSSTNSYCGRRDTTPPLAQRLLSNLSTLWQITIDEKSEEEVPEKHPEDASVTSVDEFQTADDQPIGLQCLNIAGVNARHLGVALAAKLQEKLALCTKPRETKTNQRHMPHLFPSTSGPVLLSFPVLPSQCLRVPTADVELIWRKRLLGLPTAAV